MSDQLSMKRIREVLVLRHFVNLEGDQCCAPETGPTRQRTHPAMAGLGGEARVGRQLANAPAGQIGALAVD